jgi:hypothetical protein
VNAVSHYAIDRRDHGVMPHLCKALRRYGKEELTICDCRVCKAVTS